MKRIFFMLLLLTSHMLAIAASAPMVTYTISPLKKGLYTSFLIKMSFNGDASGKTRITVPYENGQYRPQDHLEILDISNSVKHYWNAEDSGSYMIEHAANAFLTVTYKLNNALQDSLPALDEVYAQMLTGNYFYLIGSTFWITPEDSANKVYDIRMNWKGFPADWKFLSSFSANTSSQQINASIADFQQAIYMGGDFRIHTLLINERPLYFGIRGQWPFSDKDVLNVINRTVSAQRSYWNDYDVDRYTISLMPMKYNSENERSLNGRGLTNTFVSVGTNTRSLGIMDLTYLYNHELMHHWLGHLLKQPDPENAYKWFFEGFTDYFTHVIMLEEGLLDSILFKKSFNKIFSQYYGNSSNQFPNSTLEKEYWSSPEMQKLPYQRGLIFAFYLDESIRKYSHGNSSLKEIISTMLRETTLNKTAYSNDWLLELLKKSGGKDYSTDLQRFIMEGKFISIDDWHQVSGKLIMDTTMVYDPGFITDKGTIALNASIIEIREGSAIQKAGLATGDRLVGYSTTYNPADTTTLTVERGKEKIQFRYLAAKEIMIPQLK